MMNFKFILKAISVALVSFSLTLISAVSFAATDVRIMWYGDGDKENVPIAAQIDEFNAANPDINVILDIVPYDAIMNTLPIQLAAGEGPDIARVTDLGGLNKYYADITPYVADPSYYEKSFGPFLNWYRKPGDTTSIHGFHSTMTVTVHM